MLNACLSAETKFLSRCKHWRHALFITGILRDKISMYGTWHVEETIFVNHSLHTVLLAKCLKNLGMFINIPVHYCNSVILNIFNL